MSANKNKVHVWSVGGAGLNITAEILKHQAKLTTSTEVATLGFTLLDTSESNYHKHEKLFTDHNVGLFTFPNLDGSGQKRDENVDLILPRVGNVVLQNKTENQTTLNIVIHSTSGGY